MKNLFLKIAQWAANHTDDYMVAKKSEIKQKETLLQVLSIACETNGKLPPCPICGKPFDYIDHTNRIYEFLCGNCHIKKECDFDELIEMFKQTEEGKGKNESKSTDSI